MPNLCSFSVCFVGCLRPRSLRIPLAGAALALAAGCEGPRRDSGTGTADAPMTASGQLANPNPVPMDARGEFFAGAVSVAVLLGKSDAQWLTAKPGESGRSRNGGDGRFTAGLGGGGGRRGGGGSHGVGEGGGRGGEKEGRGGAGAAAGDAPRGPSIRPSNASPVQLRLRLESHLETPLEVEVLDFNSELGNFVVLPKKLIVPPLGVAEAEPMTSRLGVPAVEQIPVRLRIRFGGAKGTVEEQVLNLRPRAEPPEASSAPPPAAG